MPPRCGGRDNGGKATDSGSQGKCGIGSTEGLSNCVEWADKQAAKARDWFHNKVIRNVPGCASGNCPHPIDYAPEIDHWAQAFQIDAQIIAAVLDHEGATLAAGGDAWRQVEWAGGKTVGGPATVGMGQMRADVARELIHQYSAVIPDEYESMSEAEVRQRLIFDDRFSVMVVAAKLSDLRWEIDEEHRSSETLFVAYAASSGLIDQLNNANWNYSAVGNPVLERRATMHYPTAIESVQMVTEVTGAFSYRPLAEPEFA